MVSKSLLMSDYNERFGGVARLFGAEGLARLGRSHVCVVGIGGVGSWAVEALARSGIGALTLVDLDEVCVSNVNRQLHALDGEIGRPKIEVMARRAQAINPGCEVHPIAAFFTEANAKELLNSRFDYVIDAIDSSTKKSLMIALCRELGIPILTTGAAGGRRNPAAVSVADLARASHDRLLRETRSKLRTRHGFPRGDKPLKVDCVFSTEPQVYPGKDGAVCGEREPGGDLRLNCDSGFGTASFVTGTFGFVAAAQVVQKIAEGK
ncbi:MAG: UBA/THIF-type binding protein [Pedosphaera sp.]|nr:UBA/THIF-type binding protein [Pedosphaera sp.]